MLIKYMSKFPSQSEEKAMISLLEPRRSKELQQLHNYLLKMLCKLDYPRLYPLETEQMSPDNLEQKQSCAHQVTRQETS